MSEKQADHRISKFTSHYVSINSRKSFDYEEDYNKFTSHYVSINSVTSLKKHFGECEFTSHYVSINSSQDP